jgi:hypothetical protein
MTVFLTENIQYKGPDAGAWLELSNIINKISEDQLKYKIAEVTIHNVNQIKWKRVVHNNSFKALEEKMQSIIGFL